MSELPRGPVDEAWLTEIDGDPVQIRLHTTGHQIDLTALPELRNGQTFTVQWTENQAEGEGIEPPSL